jgi:hypothetical protein
MELFTNLGHGISLALRPDSACLEENSVENCGELVPLLPAALLTKRKAVNDPVSLHMHFYEAVRSGAPSAVIESARMRLKLLSQMRQQEYRSHTVSSIYRDIRTQNKYGRVRLADGQLDQLIAGKKYVIKYLGICPGWQKALKSSFNDARYIHSLFYDGVANAAVVGTRLSKAQTCIISNHGRNIEFSS